MQRRQKQAKRVNRYAGPTTDRVCAAPRRLPDLRRGGRARAVGRRQVAVDDRLSVVLGRLGAKALLAGNGHGVSHHLGT